MWLLVLKRYQSQVQCKSHSSLALARFASRNFLSIPRKDTAWFRKKLYFSTRASKTKSMLLLEMPAWLGVSKDWAWAKWWHIRIACTTNKAIKPLMRSPGNVQIHIKWIIDHGTASSNMKHVSWTMSKPCQNAVLGANSHVPHALEAAVPWTWRVSGDDTAKEIRTVGRD